MPNYFLLTTLLCSLFFLKGQGQSTDFLVEHLHRQIEKAQQMQGQELAWKLACFGRRYLAPDDAAMQRLYYETYYLPELNIYEEEEELENGFNAADWSPNGKH
ncbi:MAG: hypothetical protein D6772_04290, partial [Bacteroidetes bacterium]